MSHSLMVTCCWDVLKKSSKRKDMTIKKENVEVLQQTIHSGKETDCEDENLGFDVVFVG